MSKNSNYTKMEKEFRLYNKFQSSFFNLIEGKLEPQQTKGLGLLLSKSDLALQLFFKLLSNKGMVLSNGEKINLNTIDKMIVNCELSSEDNNRADIVLRLYTDKIPVVALLIEAKSINKGTSEDVACKQIDEKYKNAISEFNEFEDVKWITLTKYRGFNKDSKIISTTWNEIIDVFYNDAKSEKEELLTDYFNFLTNINNSMKFYEKEVASIPAAKSLPAIEATHIYECPFNYKKLKQKPLYLAFREGKGGFMKCLYSVDEVFRLDFKNEYYEFMKHKQFDSPNDPNYDAKIKNKIKKYVEFQGWEAKGFDIDDPIKKVFVLSDKVIKFPGPDYPRPKSNNLQWPYYDLADMFDDEKKLQL